MYTRSVARAAMPLIALSIAFLSSTLSVNAQTTVVDFERAAIPTGSTMGIQYSDLGVLFDIGYLDVDPAARSGQRVVRAVRPGEEVFTVFPFVIRFRNEMTVTRVKLFAGSFSNINGKLTAFDSTR